MKINSMKLEQQVASLELCKKLKDLGVKQESIWYWVKDDLGHGYYLACSSMGSFINGRYTRVPNYGRSEDYGWQAIEEDYSAFTVAELGEMLPKYVDIYDLDISYNIDTASSPWEWKIRYCEFSFGEVIDVMNNFESLDVSEADVRAKMLIYLLENKLITL